MKLSQYCINFLNLNYKSLTFRNKVLCASIITHFYTNISIHKLNVIMILNDKVFSKEDFQFN